MAGFNFLRNSRSSRLPPAVQASNAEAAAASATDDLLITLVKSGMSDGKAKAITAATRQVLVGLPEDQAGQTLRNGGFSSSETSALLTEMKQSLVDR